MTNRGFVKLFRNNENLELLRNVNAWQLYSYILLNVAYKEHVETVDGINIPLKVGEMIFSYSRMAKELNSTISKMRTALDILKKGHITTRTIARGYQIISLTNSSTLQDEDFDNRKVNVSNRKVNANFSQGQIARSRRTESATATTIIENVLSTVHKVKSQGQTENFASCNNIKNSKKEESLKLSFEKEGKGIKAPEQNELYSLPVNPIKRHIQQKLGESPLSMSLNSYACMSNVSYHKQLNECDIDNILDTFNSLGFSLEKQNDMLWDCVLKRKLLDIVNLGETGL